MLKKNSQNIPDKIIKAIQRLVEKLEERGYRVEKVYLYGSYARGDWLKTSDIEELMKSKGIDNLEMDLVWPEYVYLRDRLEVLRKRRQRILQQLGRA